jgi:hypothetical protein
MESVVSYAYFWRQVKNTLHGAVSMVYRLIEVRICTSVCADGTRHKRSLKTPWYDFAPGTIKALLT